MDDLAVLVGLLKHYSPTGREDSAVSYLVETMSQLGFSAQVDRTGNAVGVLGDGPRELVLLGHIDTVPGEIEVQQTGDRLYGRGAVDAKGPLACFTAAAARIGPRAGWRIVVIGALAEEGDSHGARGIVNEYRPEAAIIGEPSGWDHITLGYKGSAWFRYAIEKPMAHSAGKSDSVCDTAFIFWRQALAIADHHNQGQERIFTQLSPSLREMHSSSDGFSEKAHLGINFRLPPGLEPEQLNQELLSIAEGAQLTMSDGIPAYRANKNTALVRAFLSGIRLTGGVPAFSLKTGTADINIVAPAWGCPAVAYGPGDSSLDHTPEEHVLVQEYLDSIKVLSSVIKNLTS